MNKNDRRFECVYAGPDMMGKSPAFRRDEYPKNYQQDVPTPVMQEKETCPNCGCANPAGSNYCVNCGTPLARSDMNSSESPSPAGVYAGPPIPMQMPTYMGPPVSGFAGAPAPIDVYMGPPIPDDEDGHV